MTLRRPHDQLAGCVWLPRFIDKARQQQAGILPPDFQRAFGNALATDGAFLAHFKLTLNAALTVIGSASSDAEIAQWFLAQQGVTPATIAEWNTRAPLFGGPGQPGERTFRFALKTLYRGCDDPRVTNAFTAIAWDEGFLDEVVPLATADRITDPSSDRGKSNPSGAP